MKIILSVFISSLMSPSSFLKADDIKPEGMLAMARYTGLCSAMNMQIVFQETTNINNGDEFIERFWSTESARLGKTLEQFIQECDFFINSYNKLTKPENE